MNIAGIMSYNLHIITIMMSEVARDMCLYSATSPDTWTCECTTIVNNCIGYIGLNFGCRDFADSVGNLHFRHFRQKRLVGGFIDLCFVDRLVRGTI